MAKSQLWYTRRGEEIRGPFNVGLIQRYVLLGRLRGTDEVSIDKVDWTPLADVPELIPQVMQADLDDPLARERLLAAKRWADERLGCDRRMLCRPDAGGGVTERRKSNERRGPEPEEEVRYRVSRAQSQTPPRRSQLRFFGSLLAVAIAAVFIILTFTLPPPPDERAVNCGAPPRPGVNWSNCRLEGMQLAGADLRRANLTSADLSGANLQGSNLEGADLSFAKLSIADLRNANLDGARLKGANLTSARLSGADLRRADLSYASLRAADLTKVRLEGAVLDNAFWLNNAVCAPGSIGKCRLPPGSAPNG